MKPITLLPTITCFLVASAMATLPTAADEPQWEPLFDGKTLDGWIQRGGKAEYRVEDGAIVGSSVPGTPNSFLCTQRHYGDFVLELEYQVDPRLNSGIQIRSNSFPNYRSGQVHGYQVEIDPSDRAWSAGIYDEGRRGWLNSLEDNQPAREAFKQNDWNHYRIEAVGDSLKTWINGVPAADLIDSMTLTGFIGLQVHTTSEKEPMRIRWRNLRIKDFGSHEWESLIGHEKLALWHTGTRDTWAGEDWQIVSLDGEPENRFDLLMTDRQLTDFTVRLKFKTTESGGGLYFKADASDGLYGALRARHKPEAQPESDPLFRTDGTDWLVRTPPPDGNQYKRGEWAELTVSKHGHRIVAHIDGNKIEESKTETGPRAGRLALIRAAGTDGPVAYREVEILVPARRSSDPGQ